jgi:hypothetical protein
LPMLTRNLKGWGQVNVHTDVTTGLDAIQVQGRSNKPRQYASKQGCLMTRHSVHVEACG